MSITLEYPEDDYPDHEENVTQGYEHVGVSAPPTTPKFYQSETSDVYDYTQNITDYASFEELEAVVVKARKALFILNDRINKYERVALAAKKDYERAYRREYLATTEKTEGARKARAEIKCEELENKWLMMEQIKGELVRTSFAMKQELQALQTTAHNLRAQIKNF